uniref:Uncharacterized protein n=1 Tax=Anopheles darlingi TaxID=43151 RepID=A0A2M4DFD8_ANODA
MTDKLSCCCCCLVVEWATNVLLLELFLVFHATLCVCVLRSVHAAKWLRCCVVFEVGDGEMCFVFSKIKFQFVRRCDGDI